MAIQLYKPFVINELVNQRIATNSKTAEKLIAKQDPRVWDCVEQVIDGHPVFLNRAPTLHRLGIQAFFPKLVEGRAIRVTWISNDPANEVYNFFQLLRSNIQK